MNDFFFNLTFFFSVLTITILVGYPIARFMKIGSLLTKIFLGFTLGFAVISISGMVANIFYLSAFSLQAPVAGILFLASLKELKGSKDFQVKFKEILWEDRFFLFFALTAAILLTHTFSQIIMWAESDATFHASLIREIKEGIRVPITILPRDYGSQASYFSVYPKAFHFYSAFFVWLFDFDIINGTKTIPLVTLIMIPFGIYVLLNEVKFKREVALFAFLMTFLQFNHLFPLFFGLYPSMTSLVFILAILVFLIGDRSPIRIHILILILLLITLYFVHQRYILHALLMAGWAMLWRYREVDGALFSKYLFFSLTVVGVIMVFFGRIGLPRSPNYLLIYMTKFASVFIPEWYLLFLALPGLLLLSTRRSRKDWLILGWFIMWLSLGFLNDVRMFQLSLLGERTYQELYLLISILAAYALFAIVSSSQNKKTMVYLIVLVSFLTFPLLLGSVFIIYAPNWSLSLEDYSAMKALEGRTGIVVNVDPTGRWIYPISGMKVTNPRGMPELINASQLEEIINSPSSEKAVKTLQSLEERYGNVYIFISQRSSSSLGYSIFGNFYPEVNMKEFEESEKYETLYGQNGSTVLRFIS